MAFEFIENSEKDYVWDKDRNLKLWKSAGGGGFSGYTFEVSDKKYLVHIEERMPDKIHEFWTIEDIHLLMEGKFKYIAPPPEIYDLALEAVTTYKNFARIKTHDTITVQLAEKYKNKQVVS